MSRGRLLRGTAFFLAGSRAFPYVGKFSPPLELDLMLVFFGALFFVALAIAVILERRARNHLELEVLKRVYAGFIPLPWILAATLLANGALDAKENATYYATTVDGRYNMSGIVLGTRRLIVHSWREGRRVERFAVNFDDFGRSHGGDAVSVGVKPAVLGIRWYYGVIRP